MSRTHDILTDDLSYGAGPQIVDDAIRLYQIDMALQHLMRNAGMLGLGANVVQQELRSEREAIVGRLQKLGEGLVS